MQIKLTKVVRSETTIDVPGVDDYEDAVEIAREQAEHLPDVMWKLLDEEIDPDG